MSFSDLRFWASCILVAVILPFGDATRGQSAPAKKNKVLIYPTGTESVSQLKGQGIANVLNYGEYWVVEATDGQVASLNASYPKRTMNADYLNKVELAATCLDTTAGEPAIPSDLQQSAQSNTVGKRLRLIQFKGPVKPEWLEQVKAAGDVKVVSYIPNNAYLLYLDQAAEQNLGNMTGTNGPIQWFGKYHPYYKLSAGLQQLQSGTVDVRVAVVDGPEADQTVFGIQGFALKGIEKRETMLNQTVVTIQVRPADLSGIAQLPDVLWIEPVIKNINHDEMQALIVATDTNVDCSYTNVDGVVIGYRHGPVPGDSYLDFLNAHSFSFNPAHYPVLDIADTGLDKVNPYPYNSGCGWSGTGFYVPFHPSFFTAGAFLNDYSSLTDAIANTMCCVSVSVFESRVMYNTAGTDTDGHGTAVASVASGYDDFTNTLPYEIVHCHRDAKISLSTTNYQCVTSNSVTFVLTTNAPATDCVCTNNVTLHLVALGCLTNVTTIGDYCQRYTDFGGQDLFPNPDPFPAGVYRRDPTVTVLSWSPLTSATNNFQLGLGVSPFGRIGASLGGAQTGYAGPAGEISAAYLQDARISNNSWGQGYNGANGGVYDSRAEAYDALVRNASTNTSGATALNQEMSIVFSAGNGNGIGGAGGYGETLITSPGTAKNVITVGASKNLHLGFRASDIDNSFDIADFSSFGPTLDGRFKPEIVAPGSGISAALSQGTYTQWGCFGCDPNDTNNFQNCADFETLWPTIVSLYGDPSGGVATYYGTSFSAPAVSGGIQLLWWWFQNQLNMLQPSPAMAKAYLLNSARYLPIHDPLYTSAMDTLPSIAQGMGIMDLDRMFDLVPRVLRDESTPRAIDTPLLTTNPVSQQTFFSGSGQSYEVSGQVASNDQPFRVTLSWTDAPGDPTAFQALVNDLDLVVTMVNGGVTNVYNGNQFIGPDSVTGCPDPNRSCPDNVNNTESVFLPAGQTGPWSVLVRASTIAGNGVPNVNTDVGQDFALVVYNGQNPTDVANPATNNSCQTAMVITSFPFSFTNNLNKTTYYNVHPSPSAGRGGIDEFFRIAKPTPGVVFTNDTTGSSFNTVLSVWRSAVVSKSSAGKCGALVEVASNSGGTLPSLVTFTADGSNDYFIVVEPYNDGPGGTMVLNVHATAPAITATPNPLQFAGQSVGTTSAMKTVIYSNNTPVTVQISSVSITGSDPADFIIVSQTCEGHYIPSNSTCTVSIAFAPTAGGARTAQLVISDDATGGQRIVQLSGFGEAPEPNVCLSTTSLAFGNQAVGVHSATQNVTITNCGSTNLYVTNIVVSGTAAGDYTVSSDLCSGNTISAGGTCAFGVSFDTTTTNVLRSATLTINSSGTNSPNTVALSGTGQLPTPQACLINSIAFGSQSTGTTNTVSVIITNCGTKVLNISSIGLSGANAGEFYLNPDNCSGNAIAIGSTCSFGVNFAPTNGGLFTAAVTISSDATNSPNTVTLSGTGQVPTPQVCSISSIAFGTKNSGTTNAVSVTITNCGTAVLHVSSIGLSGANVGEFILSGDTCSGNDIGIGGTCSFGVSFAPTGMGTNTASVTITDNAPGSPQTIALSGIGGAARADLLINTKVKAKTFVGNGVFDATGASETVTKSVKHGKKGIFYVEIQNGGNIAGPFRIQGGGDSSDFAVKYFLGAKVKDSVDITSAMEAGTFSTPSMAVGAITGDTTMIRVEVTVSKTAVKGTRGVVLVSGSANGGSSLDDAVQAVVLVK